MSTAEALRELFDDIDHDKSGTISVSELGSAIQRIESRTPSEADIREIMATVDTDNSGMIDFEEFVKMMGTRTDPYEEMKAAFAAFDEDGSGTISADEVRVGGSRASREGATFLRGRVRSATGSCSRRGRDRHSCHRRHHRSGQDHCRRIRPL